MMHCIVPGQRTRGSLCSGSCLTVCHQLGVHVFWSSRSSRVINQKLHSQSSASLAQPSSCFSLWPSVVGGRIWAFEKRRPSIQKGCILESFTCLDPMMGKVGKNLGRPEILESDKSGESHLERSIFMRLCISDLNFKASVSSSLKIGRIRPIYQYILEDWYGVTNYIATDKLRSWIKTFSFFWIYSIYKIS